MESRSTAGKVSLILTFRWLTKISYNLEAIFKPLQESRFNTFTARCESISNGDWMAAVNPPVVTFALHLLPSPSSPAEHTSTACALEFKSILFFARS